ncbi:MAG: hypothetical protein RLZZ522_1273 [Verrucomicrobiota bacterium]
MTKMVARATGHGQAPRSAGRPTNHRAVSRVPAVRQADAPAKVRQGRVLRLHHLPRLHRSLPPPGRISGTPRAAASFPPAARSLRALRSKTWPRGRRRRFATATPGNEAQRRGARGGRRASSRSWQAGFQPAFWLLFGLRGSGGMADAIRRHGQPSRRPPRLALRQQSQHPHPPHLQAPRPQSLIPALFTRNPFAKSAAAG